MADPDEGVTSAGTIRTGARRDRVPSPFEPVLGAAVGSLRDPGASLYVYGSVATGTARPGSSDVDLLGVDLPDTRSLGDRLSVRFAELCRGVEVAALSSTDLAGDSDAAYGNRVFLRHYCVHLTGPDVSAGLPDFPADARAARGFNGDLADHLARWRTAALDGADPGELGMRLARKTLLAVAGLVSIHDGTWTTDRSRAVRRWSELEPGLAAALSHLESWVGGQPPSKADVGDVLARDGVVEAVLGRFRRDIGLWEVSRPAR